MAFKVTDKNNENNYIFCYNQPLEKDCLRITITPTRVDANTITAGVTLDKKLVKKLIKEMKKWLRCGGRE